MTSAKNKITAIVLATFLMLAAQTYAFSLIAKRGDCPRAPENSVEAAKLSWKAGVKVLEADFHITKSGKIICVNSEIELKELSGCNKKISDMSNADIAKISLSATKRWNREYPYKVPLATLEDILKTIPAQGSIIAEIRGYGRDFAEKFELARKSAGVPKDKIAVSCTNLGELADFKSKSGGYTYYWSFYMNEQPNSVYPAADDVAAKCKNLGIDGVIITNPKVVKYPEYISILKKSGLKVYVAPVNTVELTMELRNIGVDGVLAFNAAELLKKFKPAR